MSTMPGDDPLLGCVLENRYRVLRLLGRGGMGSVYVAQDTRLGRQYALKVMHRELTRERTNVDRFLREAQMIARLQHPNIVDIHSYGEDPSGVVFFTMELLQGDDLEARIRGRTECPYDVHDACTWAIQIARAIGAVHAAGLIHRDLKAPNVFLARRPDGTEVVKLLDFGIARPEDNSDLTHTGVTLGTPSHMSPEQLRSEKLDRRTDIYSFGVLFYKLLTGRLPFTGEPLQIAMQHWTVPPPMASTIAPEVPAAFDALIARAMAKAPADRFASMSEVEQALLAWQSSPSPAPSIPVTRHQPLATQMEDTLPAFPGGDEDPDLATPAAPLARATSAAVAPVDAHEDSTIPKLAEKPQLVLRAPTHRGWRVPALAIGLVGLVVLSSRFWPSGETELRAEAPVPTMPEVSPIAVDEEPPPPPKPTPSANEPPEPPLQPQPELSTAPPPSSPPTVPPKKRGSEGPRSTTKPPADTKPEKPATPATASPIAKIQESARACRKQHQAGGGPSITITYSIGSAGQVLSAAPSTASPLADCLVQAVKGTVFEPRVKLREQISL